MKIIIRKKGGKGSGNWGHKGRPGMVGGSSTSTRSVSPYFKEKTFYHGTRNPMQKFDASKIGTGADADATAWFGDGVYLTEEKWKAASYAYSYVDSGTVVTARVSVKNPLFVSYDSPYREYKAAGIDPELRGQQLTDALRAKGYDSVAVLKPSRTGGAAIVNELVVFDAGDIEVLANTPREDFNWRE